MASHVFASHRSSYCATINSVTEGEREKSRRGGAPDEEPATTACAIS